MKTSDSLLREIEALARTVDFLDAQARVGPTPYRDPELVAELDAKRMRLLLELDTADALSYLGQRKRYVDLKLARILGYHDAALALATYYAWVGRARFNSEPAPDRMIDSIISIDWFRRPDDYLPSGTDSQAWLALCEHNFRRRPSAKAPATTPGFVICQLEGRYHTLWYRPELGVARLYRTTLAS